MDELKSADEKKSVPSGCRTTAAIALTMILCLVSLPVFFTLKERLFVPNKQYKAAVALMEEGNYEQAIVAFNEICGYRDSEEMISVCESSIVEEDYQQAISLMNAGEYEQAIAAFEELSYYRSSRGNITRCTYLKAGELMDAGDYLDAISWYSLVSGYNDSKTKIETCRQGLFDSNYEQLKTANVGDYVTLGTYEQDCDIEHGPEPIQWLVLDVQNGKMLLISKDILSGELFHDADTDVTWDSCTLRTWLNDEFYNTAFCAAEKAVIPTVTVTADRNPEWDTYQGKSVQDKIFLLSVKEAEKYFADDNARKADATPYSFVHYDDGAVRWWLRTIGQDGDFPANVTEEGMVSRFGTGVSHNNMGVRPAMWVDISQ